ncbi:MAG TPA: hypothetical protein VLA34_11700 [Candidatus Krumholzibacterium sp.]|nr:hypothetical protein [Candidatus Krumholzibacterium sp.]
MEIERGKGFWTLITGGALLLVMLVAGQMMAFIDYGFTVSLGLQESREVVGEAGVAINKGFGVGDTIIYTPLMIIGIWGLLARKRFGSFAMLGAMAITAYWPMVCLFILLYSRGVSGFHFTRFGEYAIILTAISVFGLWGQWYLHKRIRSLMGDG